MRSITDYAPLPLVFALLLGCGGANGDDGAGGRGLGGSSQGGGSGAPAGNGGSNGGSSSGGSNGGNGGIGQAGGGGGLAGQGGGMLQPPPGREVLLYTGDGGGGPSTDLRVTSVRDTYTAAGLTAEISETLPADFAARFGVLWLMNPRSPIAAAVKDAGKDLVARGGRVVVVMEHCKNGCWGNAEEDNAFLSYVGSTVRLNGMGGAPLSHTTLVLTPVPPLTDNVNDIVVYYSGSTTGGVALGSISGGDTVIAYERIGLGDVLAAADSSMFGYAISSGDNQRFIVNLGVPLR